MKITIDTKEDSPEDIRRVVALLSHLAQDSPSGASKTNLFDDLRPSLGTSPMHSETPNAAFVNMFNSTPLTSDEENNDDEDSEEEKEETPRVIMY